MIFLASSNITRELGLRASSFPRRRILAGVLALTAVAALTGCGASEAVPASSPGASSSAAEGKTVYPLTLENCGRKITIDQAPKRAVSLDQNSTEILLSLGLESNMVGTASWTDPVLPSLAAANEKVPRLADNAPTYEVLMGADPDFVSASFGRHFKEQGGIATRDRLAETGVNSYLSPTDCEGKMSINAGGKRTKALTVDVLYQEIRDLAAIFDVKDRGEQLVSQLQEREHAAREGTDLHGATVAFWFADTNTPYMAGKYGSAALLASLTDMKNVYDVSDDWAASGWEVLADKRPQILVLGDLQRNRFPGDLLKDKTEFLAKDPLTNTLDAVKNTCYISLHGAEMNPSIRYVDGLEKIQKWAKSADAACLSK